MVVSEVIQLKEKIEHEIETIKFGLPGYTTETIQPLTAKQQTILILEENPAIRELLKWIFITDGYRYSIATQAMRSDRPFTHVNLILLDVDGSKTWQNTVVSPFWEQEKIPPLIILTCHSQRKDAVKQSSFQVLQKPFHVHDLLQAVAIALEQHTRTDSLNSSSQLERFHSLSHFD